MTTPTSKPIPSSDVVDLVYNINTMDKLISGTGEYPDRFGKMLPSYSEQMNRLGWYSPVAFAAGIQVNSPRVIVIEGGSRYFPKPELLPFTTTSTFNPDQWSMFDQSFAGAEIAQLGTYDLLRSYSGAATLVYVAGRLNDQDGAAGHFAVDEADTTSLDNNGTILVGADGRRWKRQAIGGKVDVSVFGIDYSKLTTQRNELQYAFDMCAKAKLTALVSGKVFVDTSVKTDAGGDTWNVAISIPANFTYEFINKGEVALLPNNLTQTFIFDYYPNDNIVGINPKLTGDRLTHIGSTGEWGYGHNIQNCSNVTLHNPVTANCWGDGIYIGHRWDAKINKPSFNINVYNPVTKLCRRNGISVCGGDNINIYNPYAENITGTAPQSGIDVEPEGAPTSLTPKTLSNVNIFDPVSRDCGTSGLHVAILNSMPDNISLTVFNPVDFNSLRAITLDCLSDMAATKVGQITINSPVSNQAKQNAFVLTSASNVVVDVINPVANNCATTAASETGTYDSACLVRGWPTTNKGIENLSIHDLIVNDSRATKSSTYPIIEAYDSATTLPAAKNSVFSVSKSTAKYGEQVRLANGIDISSKIVGRNSVKSGSVQQSKFGSVSVLDVMPLSAVNISIDMACELNLNIANIIGSATKLIPPAGFRIAPYAAGQTITNTAGGLFKLVPFDNTTLVLAGDQSKWA